MAIGTDSEGGNPKIFAIFFAAAILSLFIICVTLAIILVYHNQHEKISDIGSLVGAAVTGIAFIWIILGYWLQITELEYQRRDLEQQGVILKKTADATTALHIHNVYKEVLINLDRIARRIEKFIEPHVIDEIDERSSLKAEEFERDTATERILAKRGVRATVSSLARSDLLFRHYSKKYLETCEYFEQQVALLTGDEVSEMFLDVTVHQGPAYQLRKLLQSSLSVAGEGDATGT